jgi:predicted outer membrane repeat protein
MKTAITSSGDNMQALLDPRFGRAEYYCIYDDESDEITFIKNTAKDMKSGSGLKAVETLLLHDIDKVVSIDFGPKAKSVLKDLDIQMISVSDPKKSIEEIIQTLKN